MEYYTYNSFNIYSDYCLQGADLKNLTESFQLPAQPAKSVLGGRRAVIRSELPDIGPLVIKFYTRGGWIYNFVKHSYARWTERCCQREYKFLSQIRSLGIKAPEPIAYAFKGNFIYQAWLVTREISNQETLANLNPIKNSKLKDIMLKLAAQVSILVYHSIFHTDFHPGNVLVGSDNQVYLIDFDKAYIYRGSKKSLSKKYRLRWQRAINKHGLPQILNTSFRTALEKYQPF